MAVHERPPNVARWCWVCAKPIYHDYHIVWFSKIGQSINLHLKCALFMAKGLVMSSLDLLDKENEDNVHHE